MIWLVLEEEGLLEVDATHFNLAVANERTTWSVGIVIELGHEVSVPVYSSVVLAVALFVPLDAQPEVIACFWVILKFAAEADCAKLKFLLNSLAN